MAGRTLVWRNVVTGQDLVWFMNGTTGAARLTSLAPGEFLVPGAWSAPRTRDQGLGLKCQDIADTEKCQDIADRCIVGRVVAVENRLRFSKDLLVALLASTGPAASTRGYRNRY